MFSIRFHRLLTSGLAVTLFVPLLPAGARSLFAQFDDVPIPDEVSQVEFMLGEWTVNGRFRTPDVVAADRTLWYTTDRGVTRFNGQTWVAWERGQDAAADSILDAIARGGEGAPFEFVHPRTMTRIQDGFAYLMDDGRTSGTSLLYFDPARTAWGRRSFHAATGEFSFTESIGTLDDGVLTLIGTGNDRRGPRRIRTRYVPRNADSYVVHTDVSFDDGAHWIIDQIVMEVVRQ